MKERIGTAERRRRLARARTVQHKLWSLPVKMKENVTNWSRYEHMPHIHRMVIWKGLNWLSNRLGMDFRDGGLVADWIGMFFLDKTDKRLIEPINTAPTAVKPAYLKLKEAAQRNLLETPRE